MLLIRKALKSKRIKMSLLRLIDDIHTLSSEINDYPANAKYRKCGVFACPTRSKQSSQKSQRKLNKQSNTAQ